MINSNGRKRGGSAKGKMKSRTSRYGRKEILGTKHTEDNGREEYGVSGEIFWRGWSSGYLWKGRAVRIKSDNPLKCTRKLHVHGSYKGPYFYCLWNIRKNRQTGIRLWQVLNVICSLIHSPCNAHLSY